MAYVMLWHKDPTSHNRTGLVKQTILTTHGRTSLAFPDKPANSTYFVAHMWDQPRQVLNRLTRGGHEQTCQTVEAGARAAGLWRRLGGRPHSLYAALSLSLRCEPLRLRRSLYPQAKSSPPVPSLRRE